MKRILVAFLFSSPLLSFSQHGATDVLNAEKNFAAYAVQNGTKAAFLKFADSRGLVFDRGKAVNAIEAWNKREDRPGILNWHPIYGFQAASGELGFTTGPWTFQPKTINDSIVARGQFNTVWHKTANGEWKFLIDIGIGNTPDFATATFQFGNQTIAYTPGSLDDLQQAEETFVQQTKEANQRTDGYHRSVSKQAFALVRNGHLPTTTAKEVESLLNKMPATITYKQEGAGIANSGDLGYVYGTTVINGKEDNYLRVWRREGKEWKLALEVLPY